jgi:hypothetical protein
VVRRDQAVLQERGQRRQRRERPGLRPSLRDDGRREGAARDDALRADDGRFCGWLDISGLAPNATRDFFLYYGKPGLTATEANPTGVWTGWDGVWQMPTGIDATSNGRNLTASGVTAGGSVFGLPGATLGQTSYYNYPDTTWFAGHAAWTVVAYVDMTTATTGMFFRPGGDVTGTAAMALWYDNADTLTTHTNFFACSAQWSDGNRPNVFGDTGAGTVGPHVLGAAFQSGQWQSLYVDALLQTTTDVNSIGTGTSINQTGWHLRIGANNGGNNNAVQGVYARFMYIQQTLPQAWFTFNQWNMVFPEACYGFGDEDVFGDTNRAPICSPIFTTASLNATTAINVGQVASSPTGAALTVSVMSQPFLGTATVSGTTINYAARGVAGTDAFVIGVTSGGKRSTTGITIQVGAGGRPRSPGPIVAPPPPPPPPPAPPPPPRRHHRPAGTTAPASPASSTPAAAGHGRGIVAQDRVQQPIYGLGPEPVHPLLS